MQRRKILKPDKSNHLAHEMTKSECEIFRKVMTRTWNSGYETVIIHDCLVVLETKKNTDATEAQISDIIQSVYNKYGLMATLSIDHYSPEIAEESVLIQTANHDMLLEFEYDLKDKIVGATDQATQNHYFKNGKI